VFSNEVLYYASTKPDKLASPTTSLASKFVTITWNVTPNDHKRPVTSYLVKLKAKNNTFVTETNICNGALSTVVTNTKCTALMSLFTTNLGLAINDLIVVTVAATNVMGTSLDSDPNVDGIIAKKFP